MRNKFIALNKIRIIFFYFSLLVFFTGLKFQDSGLIGWNIIYTPTDGRTFRDFQFLDSLNGFAITSLGPANDTAYILKTTNSGFNWTIIGRYQSNLFEMCFLNNSLGFISGFKGGGFGIVYKTTNGGDNWQTISFGDNGDYQHIRFINPDTGWVSSDLGLGMGGIWRTTNGGISWQKQAGGVGQISFVNSRTGWAINGPNIYKTTNSGENWNLIKTFGGSAIGDIFFISPDTGWIIPGDTVGIRKTIDGGFNWVVTAKEVETYVGKKLFFLNNKRGWFGNTYYKIYTLNDTIWGKQNTPMNNTPQVKFIDTLYGWGAYNHIIHTTDGGGPVTHITNNKEEIANNYKLGQNYPNPFNQSSIINVQCSMGGNVKLKVFDITGKELKILIDEYKQPGTYSIRFDSGDLPSGIYFYSLIVDGVVMDTKKAILMK